MTQNYHQSARLKEAYTKLCSFCASIAHTKARNLYVYHICTQDCVNFFGADGRTFPPNVQGHVNTRLNDPNIYCVRSFYRTMTYINSCVSLMVSGRNGYIVSRLKRTVAYSYRPSHWAIDRALIRPSCSNKQANYYIIFYLWTYLGVGTFCLLTIILRTTAKTNGRSSPFSSPLSAFAVVLNFSGRKSRNV